MILPTSLNAKIIDSDGRPLPQIEYSDTVYVYPGERYGVLTETSAEFTDSIEFQYFDLNTGQIKNSQFVPINIAGFNKVEVEKVSSAQVKLSPNPFIEATTLEIKLKETSQLVIEIFDLEGKLVNTIENVNARAGEYTYDIGENLDFGGVYLVKISLGEENVITKKIVKK